MFPARDGEKIGAAAAELRLLSFLSGPISALIFNDICAQGKHGRGEAEQAHEPNLPQIVAERDLDAGGGKEGEGIGALGWSELADLPQQDEPKAGQQQRAHEPELVPGLQIDIVGMGEAEAGHVRWCRQGKLMHSGLKGVGHVSTNAEEGGIRDKVHDCAPNRHAKLRRQRQPGGVL